MADKNLVLEVFWNNEPIPVEDKLADQTRLIEIPLGVMLNIGSGGGSAQTWVNANTLAGFMMHSAINQANSKMEVSKYQGQIYLRGYLWFNTQIGSNAKIFGFSAAAYQVDVAFTKSASTGSPLVNVLLAANNDSTITGSVTQSVIFGDNVELYNIGVTAANTVYHIAPICIGVAKVP